jgi:hypothetical protein
MDRKVILLCAAAIPLGLAGGYAWSAMTARPARAYVAPKPTITDIPDSPDEYPAALDQDWTNRAHDNAVNSASQESSEVPASPSPS